MTDSTVIFILIRSLANGGAEKQSILLAKALAQQYAVQLIVLDSLPLHEKHLQKIREEQIHVQFLKGGPLDKFSAFRKLIRTHRADYLFSFLPSDTLLAALAGRLEGVKGIYGGVRNAFIPLKKRLVLRWLHNHLLHGTISNCHAGVRSLQKQGFRRDKFLVIHNAFEGLAQSRTTEPDTSFVNIITVGRFVEQKNYPLALRLFKQLKDAGDLPPMRYTIIGYGPLEKQIRDLIRQMGLEDDVRLLINPGQVDEHLAQADIYLSTSLFEGLSNAIMEGMSHGLPVVASRVGDNDHLVYDGKNGYLHSVEDEAGMYGSLRKLVWDQLLRQQFGLQSALIIQRDFSFCGFQQKYIDLIEDQRIPLHETV